MKAAERDRHLAGTDAIRISNEARRKYVDAEIRDRDERRASELEALDIDTEMTRRERYFFMGVTAFGVLFTALVWTAGAASGHWIFYPGSGIGLLALGGGLLKLRVLNAHRRRVRSQVRKEEGALRGDPNRAPA